MVIGDVGLLEMTEPNTRLQKRLRISEDSIDVCTPNYKPPDVCLGNQHYRDSLDMWAFGLLAAEIHSGDVLVVPVPAATAQEAQHPITYFEGIVKIVPSSNKWPPHMCLASWLEGLPFFKKWYPSSQEWLKTQARDYKPWPPLCLEGCPEGLDQLISNCLVWHPCARMTATEAKNSSFLQLPGHLPLHVLLAAQHGKNGVGTIARGDLDPDLLRYLQTCPS